jgi:hypothetical protein
MTVKTSETRARMAEAQRRRWADPDARAAAKRKWKERAGQTMTQAEAAAITQISTRSTRRAIRVMREGTAALNDAVIAGRVKLRTAEYLIQLPAELQDEAAANPALAREWAGKVRLLTLRAQLDGRRETLDSDEWVGLLVAAFDQAGVERVREMFIAAPADARETFLALLSKLATAVPSDSSTY